MYDFTDCPGCSRYLEGSNLCELLLGLGAWPCKRRFSSSSALELYFWGRKLNLSSLAFLESLASGLDSLSLGLPYFCGRKLLNLSASAAEPYWERRSLLDLSLFDAGGSTVWT
jgi:hypothetical protein